VAPPGERRALWWALGSLAHRLGLDILDGGLDPDTCSAGDLLATLVARSSADTAGLFDGPETRLADPPRPRGWVHDHVLPGGRWRVAPAPLLEQLASTPVAPRAGLVLTPRRVTRRMNSAVGDVVATPPKPEDQAVLLNAGDARTAGIADGEQVRIRSRSGQLVGLARVRADIVAGTVSVPHGLPGQNVSLLTAAEPGWVDPLTGMVVQSGLPVTIERA
jgi:anaerobic selenocysteine-containing dehydrogenase